MHALAHRPAPLAPAHRSQGFGRIGQPHAPRTPGRVLALPRRRATDVPLSGFELAAAARRQRTLQWQRLCSIALRRLAALVADGWSAWCEVQLARSRQRALHDLDDRTLRDLGLSRCEVGSLDAELRGAAEPTRIHALAARPEPPGSTQRSPAPWAALVSRLLAAWSRQQHVRACFASLARLDDGLLRDIGLSRGGLASAAAQLAAGERPKGWR